MKKYIIKLKLLLAFILLITYGVNAQPDDGGTPNYQVPIVKPVINDYVNFIKTDCDHQVNFYDVYVDIDIIPGKYKKEKIIINPTKVFIYPINNEQNGIWIEDDMEGELFNVKSSDGFIKLRAKAYDERNTLWATKDISVTTEKDGMVRTSKKIHDALVEWREEAEAARINPGGTGPGPDVGPGTGGDIFTLFCGRNISKVELFAFFTEYLELSNEELCRFKDLYSQITDDTWNAFSGNLLWDDELCELLTLFWNDFVNDGNPNGGEVEDCNCKIIKSATHVRHSLGAEVGLRGEANDEVSCPDVPLPEEGSLWWGKNAPIGYKTQHQNNWANILWGWQGAAKMIHLHANQDRDEDNMVDPNVAVGQNGETSSSLSFSMFCFDPFTLGPAFNEHCDCSKVVNVGYYYGVKFHGGVNTNGSGKIKGAIDDNAVFIRINSNGVADSMDFGRAYVEVECESNDTTSVLTDIGSFTTALISAAQGFDISAITGTISTIENLVSLGTQIFDSHLCGESSDLSQQLIAGKTQVVLTAENYSATFILFSYVTGKIFTEDDESEISFTMNSDYYLAGTLYSTANSDTAYCCQELVGSYAIGDLSAFTNDDLGENKFKNLFNSPLTLADKQNRVATCILNTGGEAFGIVVFPGINCCQPQIGCYYDCQYYGECHPDDGDGFDGNDDPANRSFHLNTENEVRLFPSPIERGNFLSIENLNGHSNLLSVEILNNQGQLVKSFSNISTTSEVIEVDLRNVNSGIYFVRYISNFGSVTYKIYIK